MKKKAYLAVALSTILIGGSVAGAQMMGDREEMMRESPQQYERRSQDRDDDYRYMMGGYGMGPCVMGGYGMGPGMMGGYGMGPGMMGGYGMGHHGMMGGYGMGPGMMGEHGWWKDRDQFSSPEQYEKFLDETKDLRKKLHDLRFEYGEMMHDPKTTVGEMKKMQQDMYELQEQIQQKAGK
ncbi:MAG TPA: hypothetical protein ENO11_00375 [Desulfobacteraceae bacterium]|nr:hypothetical protein [Desulfobacteraceae bacterium]